MIGGEVLRSGLRLAALLLFLSVVTLLFQDRSSAGFVVSVMALVVSVLFIAAVLLLARLGRAALPERGDKSATKPYNTSVTQEGRRRDP